MDSNVRELLELVFRWVHLIAGIMWVGNSMLFNWLDRNLIREKDSELHQGSIWLLHSGAFYEVEKKLLAPNEMPKTLHWFKWQSYTTWVSGMFLLGVVYYMGGGAFLVDESVAKISVHAAIGIGLGSILGGFVVYDLLWRSPIAKVEWLAVAISLALLGGILFALTHLFSGRAAYIHFGAILGTCMAGNVFFHIIPSQHGLVNATKTGQPQDPKLSKHAKQRSIHNNYMTFPLLFIMLSNHFPATYGSHINWIILAVVTIVGAGVRHFMNIRFTFGGWMPALFATVIVGVVALFFLTRLQPAAATTVTPGEHKVTYTQIRLILDQRCRQCHSAHPTDDVWKQAPNNIMFDTPEQVSTYAERIKTRAVITKTMPLGNKTKMTDDEREVLAEWLLSGASTH